MMHGKSIHYPSGYPMTRSPPFLVSSSPGPDPYRSNDNVYEELGPSRESDGESDPPMHSDDDFAEDELSLPGERSFNKNNGSDNPPTLPTTPGSNLYHERASGSVAANSSTIANGPERISVLSSSSSTQDASTATVMSTNSSHNNNSNNNTINNNSNSNNNSGSVNGSLGGRSGGNIFSGMLRHTTGRNKNTSRPRAEPRSNEINVSSSIADTTDFVPVQQLYDNRSNLMTLAYMPIQHQNHTKATLLHQPYHPAQLHINNNNNLNNNGPNAHSATPSQLYNSLDNDVDRRNRINTQMSKQQVPAVATIFRERIHYPGSGRYPQPYYATNSVNGLLSSSMRARTNPRSIDRRHRITAPLDPLEPAYGYAEPVFQHQVNNYHYDTCGTTTLQQRLPPYPAYIIPEYASGPSVAVNSASYRGSNLNVPLPHAQPYHNPTQLYARGDSSFGSDSGYSHHTPASSIGRHDYEPTLHVTGPTNASTNTNTPKTPSKLSAAFNFGWNRRKNATSNTMPPANANATRTINRTEATSPNNNSANTTIASTLEINTPVATVATVSTSNTTSANSSAGTTTLNNNAKA